MPSFYADSGITWEERFRPSDGMPGRKDCGVPGIPAPIAGLGSQLSGRGGGEDLSYW